MDATTGWAALEADAPELAERVRARFEANLHHIIATIRPDGSPRLSGSEVTITDGDVTIGMMAGSRKLADVGRDPRVEIHSAPLEADLAEGDAKLAGTLVEIPPRADGPGGSYFRLDLRLVSLVQVVEDELVFTTWTPDRSVRTTRRS